MKNKLAFFNGRTFFWGIGLSFIFKETGTFFWISNILGTIIGFLLLLLIKKKNDYKIIKVISGFVLATAACSVFVHMGHTVYLKETPLWMLAFFPILCGAIASKSKEKSFQKVANIFFATVLFMFLFKIISLVPQTKPENFLPLIPCELKNIIWCAFVFAIISITPIVCLNDISDKKNILLNYGTAMTTVILTSFIIMGTLGLKATTLYRFPEYVVLKRIEMLDFISNIDNILNISLATDFIFTVIAGFKNMEIKNKIAQVIIPILMLILIVIICQNNEYILSLFKFLPFIMLGLLIMTLLPKK